MIYDIEKSCDLQNEGQWFDEFGAEYTANRTKLIKVPKESRGNSIKYWSQTFTVK